MNILKLNNNKATEENVLKLIAHIKYIETQKGLTKAGIEYKYTHGYCSSLVEMVKHFLPDVRPIYFWNYEECSHYCIGIENPNKKSAKYLDLDYFDINGKKTYEEMVNYIYDYFTLSSKCFNIGEKSPSRDNPIKEYVYNSVIEENEQIVEL